MLYLTMFRDGDGVPLVPRDVLARVVAVSRAPVFGVYETYLGHGIVAGSIASYAEQGRRAGELRRQGAERRRLLRHWRPDAGHVSLHRRLATITPLGHR